MLTRSSRRPRFSPYSTSSRMQFGRQTSFAAFSTAATTPRSRPKINASASISPVRRPIGPSWPLESGRTRRCGLSTPFAPACSSSSKSFRSKVSLHLPVSFATRLMSPPRTGWIDVMESVMNITGRDKQPEEKASQFNAMLLVFYNLIGALFMCVHRENTE